MKSDFLTNLFFRALQTVSIATMIVRLLLPMAIVAALYLLWRIARNLEKPPKLTEEVKIVRKSLSEMLKENRTRKRKRLMPSTGVPARKCGSF